jgi:glycosyltransferase involved in cell wall biosynthesis
MRVVFVTVWFSENMGYIENCLPKAMASLGHDVHVISSTAQVYYNDQFYKSVYEPYLGPNITQPLTKNVDGFLLHRLPFKTIQGKIYFKGLIKELDKIKPDIVQVFDAFSFTTLQTAFGKSKVKYKFCTANHTVLSVFPLANKNIKTNIFKRIAFYFTRTVPGALIAKYTDMCYPATIDASFIAEKYYGVPEKKLKVAPLGVDTQFFSPLSDSDDKKEIENIRNSFNFKKDDIVCIYTGRFTKGKNPLCLAEAIEKLHDLNEPYKALFMGNGEQSEIIKQKRSCIVHDFVQYHQLIPYYRMANIGVWPRQESTSMLDAAACGLPVVISNNVKAIERVEGNGLTYIENDVNSMVEALLKLKDTETRKKLGDCGIKKIQTQYSWLKIASERIEDYSKLINK